MCAKSRLKHTDILHIAHYEHSIRLLSLAISKWANNGPAACLSRVSTLPSQNSLFEKAVLSTVGVFRCDGFAAPACPIAVGCPSSPPFDTSWQDAQLIAPLFENLVSKNSFLPSFMASAFSVMFRSFRLPFKAAKSFGALLSPIFAASSRNLSSKLLANTPRTQKTKTQCHICNFSHLTPPFFTN